MNFIVEFLPKMENSNEFVYVVRAQNGFPLQVCESLNDVTNVMEKKFEVLRKSISNSASLTHSDL